MPNGTLVIEGGRITRINLTGEGETAEPVNAALASGPSPALGALLAVAGLLFLSWFFLKPKRRRGR